MDKTLLALAASLVLVPILIGILKGHMPIQVLGFWGIPLAAVTFLFAVAMQSMDHLLDPKYKLILSLLFSFACMSVGIYTGFIQPRSRMYEALPLNVRSGMRVAGSLFLGFGFLWGILSLVQYLHQAK